MMNDCRSTRVGGGFSALSSALSSALLLAVLLCACSPTYDWRDIPAGGALVLFPDKPQSQERNVELDGLKVDMNMQSAHIGNLSFALARVDLPAGGDPAVGPRLMNALRAAMMRNIDGKPVQQAQANISRVERGQAPVAGEAIEVGGQSAGKPIALNARLVTFGNHVWQAVVYGPREDMSQPAAREAVDTFLLSLRLE